MTISKDFIINILGLIAMLYIVRVVISACIKGYFFNKAYKSGRTNRIMMICASEYRRYSEQRKEYNKTKRGR